MRKHGCIVLTGIFLGFLWCAGQVAAYQTGPMEVTDYSKTYNWLMLSDSIDKTVDVFYLYPTAWSAAENGPISGAVTDPGMRATAAAVYEKQATAFDTVGNMFAPFYRQTDATAALNMSADERNRLMADIPFADAKAAFDYYIKHHNRHRPFILVAHSQGSTVMLEAILKDYLAQNPLLMNRLVAAYIIGYGVTRDDLDANPHLRFAQSRFDTGVIISYNTENIDYNGQNPVLLPGGISINPVTWTLDEEYAPAALSLGARINGIDYPHYADAIVDKERGVIKNSTTDLELFKIGDGKLFPPGILHNGDIPLYYYDLRQNAQDRVNAFWK